MVKNRLATLPFLLLFLSLGCASSGRTANTSGMPLDTAIREAALLIDSRLTKGNNIALVNFNSPSEKFSEYVLEELAADLLDSNKLVVVDRKELDLIRTELQFQASGEVSDESAQRIGQMLGAQSVVTGTLTTIGSSYRLMLRVLQVETGKVEAQYRNYIAVDSHFTALFGVGSAQNTQKQDAASRERESRERWEYDHFQDIISISEETLGDTSDYPMKIRICQDVLDTIDEYLMETSNADYLSAARRTRSSWKTRQIEYNSEWQSMQERMWDMLDTQAKNIAQQIHISSHIIKFVCTDKNSYRNNKDFVFEGSYAIQMQGNYLGIFINSVNIKVYGYINGKNLRVDNRYTEL
ncbi:MAG: penicillin-binding protein activator LpoB [Treponema sp.]|jgi:TolB-like protein|nr:penicillin-binding protein activator LpoB [Treponema sp.]